MCHDLRGLRRNRCGGEKELSGGLEGRGKTIALMVLWGWELINLFVDK